ncbi:acetyltransferase [Gramella lutea]|uniref:Acetyltransferase n=1 Tax=Christiangramia lutea TaxID=1607951 RepID=A0A9X1V2R9_9FLAO|nr:acetyltransferase [Christiangramia lutea]MCH4822755.1 acetyltransferase [Christiangramia lutea]
MATNREKLVIFPFNGNGLEALDCLDPGKFDFIGFIDDDSNKKSDEFQIFSRGILQKNPDLRILAVPGGPESFIRRKEIISSLRINEERFVTVVHPSASIGRNVSLGRNCLIMSGVVLTSNSIIEDHVCILPNSIIHHDSRIGSYTLIGSKVVIAGSTSVGSNCYIGSGSNIKNGLSIGEKSLIGMGSNILKDVQANSKMVGNPARNLNLRIDQVIH